MSEIRTTLLAMNNQTYSGLIELGLSDKEALLYLSSLTMGPATAQQLALESDLKRATVYPYIDSLVEKGLFHIEINGARKLFIAESPDKLATLLDRKKQILTTIMPLLVQDYLHSSPSMNTIKMYYGLAGIKFIYDDILTGLKDGDEYFVISDQQKWHALDPNYFENFIIKRSKLNLVTKLLLQNTSHARTYKNKEDKYHERIKLIPKNIDLNINMVILPTKVIIVQIIEPLLAILIENPNVAAMNKILFNVMWEIL